MIPVPFRDLTECHAELLSDCDFGRVVPYWLSVEVVEEDRDLLRFFPQTKTLWQIMEVLLFNSLSSLIKSWFAFVFIWQLHLALMLISEFELFSLFVEELSDFNVIYFLSFSLFPHEFRRSATTHSSFFIVERRLCWQDLEGRARCLLALIAMIWVRVEWVSYCSLDFTEALLLPWLLACWTAGSAAKFWWEWRGHFRCDGDLGWWYDSSLWVVVVLIKNVKCDIRSHLLLLELVWFSALIT